MLAPDSDMCSMQCSNTGIDLILLLHCINHILDASVIFWTRPQPTLHCWHKRLLADTVQKNHYKENLRRIQRIQAQSKKKQLEAQTATEVQQKSTKYNSVPSKVFLQVHTLNKHDIIEVMVCMYCSFPIHLCYCWILPLPKMPTQTQVQRKR